MMSKDKNTLDYLLDAYRTEVSNNRQNNFKKFLENKKYLEKEFIYSAFLIITIIFGIVIVIFDLIKPKRLKFITLVLLIVNAIVLTYFFYKTDKENKEKYKSNFLNHRSNLDNLINILKDFDLYKKEKLKALIEMCDQELVTKNNLNTFLRLLTELFFKLIVPILAFVLGAIAEKLELKEVIYFGSIPIYIILILPLISIIIYMIADPLINYRKNRIKSLRFKLTDIHLTRFSKDDTHIE